MNPEKETSLDEEELELFNDPEYVDTICDLYTDDSDDSYSEEDEILAEFGY